MEATSNTQDSLSKLTQLAQNVQEWANKEVPVKCTWRGKFVIVKGKDVSEDSLWRQLKQYTNTCMPTDDICVQIGLCQRNLKQIHEKTKAAYNKASFIDRAIHTLFGIYRVFFGPDTPQTTTHEFLYKMNSYEERLKMQKTIEFTERYGDRYEPLRKLIVEEITSSPNKQKMNEIAAKLAPEIIKADIRDIPYLIKSANDAIAKTHLSDDLKLASPVKDLLMKEDFKKRILEASGSSKVLFESAINNTLQNLDKEKLRSLATGDEAKQLHKFLFSLEDNSNIFPQVENAIMPNLVRKIREALSPFYTIRKVTPEEKKQYFPHQKDQFLFEQLLEVPSFSLYGDKTLQERDKLWFQACSIIKTLAAQKENSAAQKAAIEILHKIKPPQSNSDHLIDNIKNYSSYYAGFEKQFLKKAIICALIKENQLYFPSDIQHIVEAYLSGHADPRGKEEREARRSLNVFSLFRFSRF